MIEAFNSLAWHWWQWMSQMAWQAGLLILLVALADRLLRRRVWPHLRMALWAAALVKLIVPPSWSSPLGIPSPSSLWRGAAIDFAGSPHQLPLSAEPGLSLQAWLMALWMGGSALLAGALVTRWHRMRRGIRPNLSGKPIPQWLLREADWAAGSLGLKRTPRLHLMDGIQSAAAFGLMRPVVLLPAEALHEVPLPDWRNVLLHEMAHIRRGDLWLQAFCQALLVVYWFHPLLYLVRRQVEQLRELCCDSLAASRNPSGAEAYRRTLLIFARRLLQTPPRRLMPVSLLSQQENIVRRLEWLKKPARAISPKHHLASALLAATVVMAAVPMASPPADEPLSSSGDLIQAQAWENLRQAAQGKNPGCLRLRYSALYLTLQQEKESSKEVPPE